MAACPKCAHESDANAAECPRCGVVFARWRASEALQVRVAAALDEAAPDDALAAELAGEAEPAPPPRIDRAGWLAFGGGALGAVLAMQLWIAQAALSGFVVLVHEMGHALFGWLYGYPSIPAFDFTYGGGVTLHRERSWLVLGAVLGAGVYGVLRLRHPSTRNVAGALLALHALVAVTPAHDAAIVAMGHGGELGFATLALHRALSGRGCTLEAERPLYALIGWFLVLQGLRFAWQLRTSGLHRELYENAKGGGHWMDFSRLAEQHLHVPLAAVATAFLVLCLAPPLIALALQRLRRA